ncbi:MAG: UDP-N-acetylglucosamine 2-epimerase, partial [Ignavibacteriaceae bacterium]|nr:UDP-N-acetylglucosamine 2-epimerase [Ignavibacteriaceae bacterium]
ERVEAIEQGTVKLVGISTQLIIEECERLIFDNEYYRSFSLKPNPYGDGTAAAKIKNILRTKSDFIHRPLSE